MGGLYSSRDVKTSATLRMYPNAPRVIEVGDSYWRHSPQLEAQPAVKGTAPS